jgi:GR25 family glycosyltransferase involved in LPS biosynthesis
MQIDLREIPVYYINLEGDKDKKKRIESMLKDLGFKDVRRFEGHDIRIPKLGCATAHNNLLGILSKSKGPILVLEDDVIIKNIKKFNPIIDVPKSADAVYLGNSKYGLYKGKGVFTVAAEKYDYRLYRIYNMLGAHAILYLNKDYSKFLSNATKFQVEIRDNQDKARASTLRFFEVYAFDTPVFIQKGRHHQATSVILSEHQHLVNKEKSS